MIVALIDNGSRAPAAHATLRTAAAALTDRVGVKVHPVSWKHSHRLPRDPNAPPAWVLPDFVRAMVALGQREFVFVPFFLSAEGAIGTALRRDLELLQSQLGWGAFEFTFSEGLAAQGAIAPIVADRIRARIDQLPLRLPPAVIVVDHGGPSPESARLRDTEAARLRRALGPAIGPLVAASLEGAEYPHNRPLFAEALRTPPFSQGDVIVAPLFLSPGRHAGPAGDLIQIARDAERRSATTPLRCHFADLVGTHPLATTALTAALRRTLAALPSPVLT
jgi:sirohydrochlorin ferrochelatase